MDLKSELSIGDLDVNSVHVRTNRQAEGTVRPKGAMSKVLVLCISKVKEVEYVSLSEQANGMNQR